MTPTDRARLLRARERMEQARDGFHRTLAEMRRSYSLADLGDALGVSRQAVHKMLRRR